MDKDYVDLLMNNKRNEWNIKQIEFKVKIIGIIIEFW